jgi:hypothetical protein
VSKYIFTCIGRTRPVQLLIPALITLTLLVAARLVYSRPEDMETDTLNLDTGNLHAGGGWPFSLLVLDVSWCRIRRVGNNA